MNFEGDLLITSTNDGGEIEIKDNLFTMTNSFETASYISLFGGNIKDNGTESTKNQSWWGNQLTNNKSEKIISRTMAIIKGLPATPSNLRKIEQAVLDDLNWFKDDGICDTIEIKSKIPKKNWLELEIKMLKDGNNIANFKFIENWKGAL